MKGSLDTDLFSTLVMNTDRSTPVNTHWFVAVFSVISHEGIFVVVHEVFCRLEDQSPPLISSQSFTFWFVMNFIFHHYLGSYFLVFPVMKRLDMKVTLEYKY